MVKPLEWTGGKLRFLDQTKLPAEELWVVTDDVRVVHDAICRRASFLDRYPYTRTASDLRELSKQIIHSPGELLMINYS